MKCGRFRGSGPEVGFWQAPCVSQMGYELAASPGISRQWRSQGTRGTTPTMEVINIVPTRPALLSGASSAPRPGRHLVDAAHVTLLPPSAGAGSIVTAHPPRACHHTTCLSLLSHLPPLGSSHTELPSVALRWGWGVASTFCKGPDGKYFRCCGLWLLS